MLDFLENFKIVGSMNRKYLNVKYKKKCRMSEIIRNSFHCDFFLKAIRKRNNI